MQPCIQCLGAIRLSNVSHVNILAPDPLFRGIENIRDVNPFLARNWPIIEERVVDEFAVLALLLPTHTSAFWESWPPGWRESLPNLSNLAANLAASERLIKAAKLRVPIESVFTDLYPQLTACLDEVQKLSAS